MGRMTPEEAKHYRQFLRDNKDFLPDDITDHLKANPKLLDEPCPICGKPLVERRGRYGMFKSCSDYPKCPGPKGVKKVEA